MTFEQQVDAVIAAYPFGKPSAAKRGRREQWPYVPVIDHGYQKTGCHVTKTEQIRGKAFDSREKAVDYAARCIEARKKQMTKQLFDPRYRALREQWGLPREIAEQGDIQHDEN